MNKLSLSQKTYFLSQWLHCLPINLIKICTSYMHKQCRLWECNTGFLSAMDVKYTFKSLNNFVERESLNPLTNINHSGPDTLLYWRWNPSFKKAIEYKVQHILDFFDDLDDDDDYKNGTDGSPHDDMENHLIYKDYDYLLLYTQRLSSDFHTNSYKITVKDEDENAVRRMLKRMIKTTMTQFVFDYI